MMTISPSYKRCLVYNLMHMAVVLFVPVWVFAWLMGELTVFGLIGLSCITFLGVIVFVPIFALSMASMFVVAIDDERLTWEVLDREIRFEDVKAVRGFVFVYSVSSRRDWFRGIAIPALFLMDGETRQDLADHLRRVLPPGNPLLRLAR